MERNDCITLLEDHGVKPTANRIIVARTLGEAERPMSMKDLENTILSLDKSSIFRALTLFRDHHVVHAIEDGEGGVKYELCHSHDEDRDDDEHVHFHCRQCNRTICLYDTPLPNMDIPRGYEVHGANFMLRGICPDCLKKMR